LNSGQLATRPYRDWNGPLSEPSRAAQLGLPARVLAFLLTGYLFFDRAFAYLHIPGTPFFIGEATLVLAVFYLLLVRPSLRIGEQVPAILLVLFLIVSFLRTMPYVSTYGLEALRDSAPWYYAIVAFLVLAIVRGTGVGGILRWYERLLPAFCLWAPPAILLKDQPFPTVPDSDISVFAHRSANTAVMLTGAVLYYWIVADDDDKASRIRRAVIAAAAGLVVVLAGISNRGGLVSSAVAFTAAALLARRPTRRGFVSIMIATVLGVFAVAWILDLRGAVFANQREVSAEQLVNNITSIVSARPNPDSPDLSDNVSWRTDLWGAIFVDVGSNAPLQGYGYGVNVAALYGFEGEAEDLRSAHNSHITIFARSGLIGFGLWALMWTSWFHQLLKARRRFLARGMTLLADVNTWLIAIAAAILTNAIFDPTIESPQVAAWVWAIFGAGLGLIVNSREVEVPGATSRHLSRL
jgi:hypothetical protein